MRQTYLLLALGALATLFLVKRTRTAVTSATSQAITATTAAAQRVQSAVTAIATGATRGVRNNNPGNIKKNPANQWQGTAALQPDAVFVTFTSPEYGYRALAILLRNYYKQGYRSLATIMARYAPGTENNTTAYINTVKGLMNVSGTAILDLTNDDTLFALMKAITRVEQGGYPWPDDVIYSGINMA